MNRICSIGRCARVLAELALAAGNPLTKAAKSRVRHRIALLAAIAGLVAPLAAALPATAAPAAGTAPPDTVTQWNLTMIAGLEAAAIPPPPSARIGAIVQASVFDAVNGIERRYAFYHVAPAAPRGASRAAAAASAAYTTLVALIPGQKPLFDAQLAATLAQISDNPSDPGRSVQRGLAWGRAVATDILTWRATDGFAAPPPPYVVGSAPGDWQPTPPLFLAPPQAPLFRQFAAMTPFALTSPAQFAPPGPPPLTSARYARDLAQVQALGSAASTTRTAEQTQTAIFWQDDTPAAMWNRVANQLAQAHHATLIGNARLLAQLNIALADATIAIWNAKNTYNSWRPGHRDPRRRRPGLDAAAAHARLPGVPLRALRRQQRRRLGAGIRLRQRHPVHGHLGRATRRPARLRLLLRRGAAGAKTRGSTPASTSASPAPTAPPWEHTWPGTSPAPS